MPARETARSALPSPSKSPASGVSANLAPPEPTSRTAGVGTYLYLTMNVVSTGRWSDGMTPDASRVSGTCDDLTVRFVEYFE